MLEKLKQYGIGIENQHVLDIGTANGLFARDIARQGSRVTGIDLSSDLINQAREVNIKERLPIEYMKGNAEDLPFDNTSVEAVTAVYCWHWFNRPNVANEVYRVLEDGGRMAIVNYDWLPSRSDIALSTQTLIEEFNPQANKSNKLKIYPEWIEDLYTAGFSDVETFSFDVNIQYTLEHWIGRIQASPEIGGALDEAKIIEFNKKLNAFLEEYNSKAFSIPYRAFGIIGLK
ncbi:methyltransferase domain-containing protein [Halobacillus sp. Nhm2S1]|nr:methyltransferase domain-containing protein [Halobacillus sp. Nhm2S1]